MAGHITNTLTLCLGATVAGVASPLLYFHRGEHHFSAITYLQAFLSTLVASVSALYALSGCSSDAIGTTSVVAGSYLAGVYGSLLVYRLFFSPWNKFPGPWQTRISGLWITMYLQTKLGAHHRIEALHEKYGKYVRIAPDTLSISDADLIEKTFEQGSKFRKATWYAQPFPNISMHGTRDRALHDRRRRVWAPGFSDKALREYEPKVRAHNMALLEQVRAREGMPMDVSMWL